MIPAVHTRYVLDASVAAKWFTRHGEEDRDKALALRDLHRRRRCRLIVPEFGFLEILNAIRFSPRATEADTAAALAMLGDLQLQVEPMSLELLRKAVAIAWRFGVTVYDAAYVALADTIGFPLLTADEVLVRRLGRRGSVIALRDLEMP